MIKSKSIKIKCKHCQEGFLGYSGSKFCSNSCVGKYKKSKTPIYLIKCKKCGKNFNSNKSTSLYCNTDCALDRYNKPSPFVGKLKCTTCREYKNIQDFNKDRNIKNRFSRKGQCYECVYKIRKKLTIKEGEKSI